MGHNARLNTFSHESGIELPTTVLDRLGRPLKAGDEVLVLTEIQHIIWKVQGIFPMVDLRAPNNAVKIQLFTPLTITAARSGETVREIVLVRASEQAEEPVSNESKMAPVVPTMTAWQRLALAFRRSS